jgi:hypothetical protein
MLTYGANFCTQSYTVGPAIEEQKIWYYDEKNTMFQIKQYDTDHSLTGNPSQWDACIANGNTYRTYVIANNGTTRAYYVFPNGLYKDWAINGDTTSKSAVLLLGSGSSPYTNLDQGGLARAIYAREAAYRLNAEIFNYKAGDTSRTAYMAKAVDINIARADQWVTSGTAEYIQPFMVGLWAQALITCYDDPVCTGYHDARIGASIKKVADYLWTNAWNLSLFPNAFYYNSAQSAAGQAASPGSDYRVLNNLISPMYAWLFKTTGNTTYRDEANTIFQNGVLLNPVGGGAGETGKSFNENYRWSFDFVTWMSDPNPPVVKPIVGVSVR